MLQTTVSKIQERSPLKYNLARKLVSMDPRHMVSNPDNATKMFQQVLQILIENKWKTAEEADEVLVQYRKFVFDAKKYHTAKFSSFKSGEDRLDPFLSEILQMQIEYQDLWLTMQLLLTLSHGQATVERGFSVNKDILTPNLQEGSLQAIRTCSQFSVSPEHKGCRLCYHWTSIFLQSCFKQIQYVPHGKERRTGED